MDVSPLSKVLFGHITLFKERIIIELRPENVHNEAELAAQTQQVKDAYALMATCRQVQAECQPVFYGANIFSYVTRGGTKYTAPRYAKLFRRHLKIEALMLHGWLHYLGDGVKLLQRLDFDLVDWRVVAGQDRSWEIDYVAEIVSRMHAVTKHVGPKTAITFGVQWTSMPCVVGTYGGRTKTFRLPLPSRGAAQAAFEEAVSNTKVRIVSVRWQKPKLDLRRDLYFCIRTICDLVQALQKKLLLLPAGE